MNTIYAFKSDTCAKLWVTTLQKFQSHIEKFSSNLGLGQGLISTSPLINRFLSEKPDIIHIST